MIKLLKACTDSPVTSFQCKYAVEEMLMNLVPDDIGLGNAIRRVIKYYTLRGNFDSVHPELQKIGITRVEVTEEGFFFIRNTVRKLVDGESVSTGTKRKLQSKRQNDQVEGPVIQQTKRRCNSTETPQ